MSSDIVSHNVSGILLTLWEDCEEIVSGDEYPSLVSTCLMNTTKAHQMNDPICVSRSFMSEKVGQSSSMMKSVNKHDT